jgi:hypothetical protein
MESSIYTIFILNIRKYDNIKWFGGVGFNMVENILIRVMGYYFFQMAVSVPFLIKEISAN